MRHLLMVVTCVFMGALPLGAQDTAEQGKRAVELRRQIEDRFAARVQEELGLTDQQASRMREVVGGYSGKRRAMEADERRLRQAMAGELRPGVAANKDRVSRLTDQLLEQRVRYAQSYRDEVKDLSSFLDAVQVAQFLILRERLFDRIREVQGNRGQEGGVRRRMLLQP
jgi:hypothetical protein